MAWRGLVVGAAITVVVALLVSLSSVILPVFLALLFVTVLLPLADRLRDAGLPAGLASGLAVPVLLVALLAVGWLTIRAVADQWTAISDHLAAAVDDLKDSAADSGLDAQQTANVADDVQDATGSVVHLLVTGAVHVLPVVAAVLTTVGLSLFVAFFYAKDGRRMWARALTAAGGNGPLVDRVGRRVWSTLAGYMRGQTMIAAIDAGCIGLGAVVLGVPNAGAIALLTFFGAYIPYLGAALAGAVGVLLAVADGGIGTGVLLAVPLTASVLAALAELSAAGYFATAPASAPAPGDVIPGDLAP